MSAVEKFKLQWQLNLRIYNSSAVGQDALWGSEITYDLTLVFPWAFQTQEKCNESAASANADVHVKNSLDRRKSEVENVSWASIDRGT